MPPSITRNLINSLEQRLKRNRIFEKDLEERFVLGSGSGGQKINKTSSCVYLKHLPTGAEVSCQESRSRERNRELARERLCEQFEEKRRVMDLKLARERSKRRFKNRRPSPAEKRRRRQRKTQRSEKKQLRQRVRE